MNIIDACILRNKRRAVDKSHFDRIAFHCMALTQTLLARFARSVCFFVLGWEGVCLLKLQVLICGLFLRTMVRFGPALNNLLISRTTSVRYPTSQDFFFHPLYIIFATLNIQITMAYIYIYHTVTIKYVSS